MSLSACVAARPAPLLAALPVARPALLPAEVGAEVGPGPGPSRPFGDFDPLPADRALNIHGSISEFVGFH